MLLQARIVVPVTAEPILDGCVRIAGNSIQDLGTRQAILPKPGEKILDLGESVLLPGFVNAHSHIGFPLLEGSLAYQQHFSDWIWAVLQSSMALSPETKADLIRKQTRRLLETGSTTVALHSDPTFPLEFVDTLPFKTHFFVELLGAKAEFARENLRQAIHWKTEALINSEPEQIALTPHSLYSVASEVLQESMWRKPEALSIHLLESQDEDLYLRSGRGPLSELIQKRGGVPLPVSEKLSPVDWLIKASRGASLLVIHGNYLQTSEINALQEAKASVVHCPGSFEYFKHGQDPLRKFLEADLNLALGTDSLASNKDLSMFREMRLLKERVPQLSSDDILYLATMGGSLALKTNGGCIAPGKDADLIAVPLTRPGEDPREAILKAEKVNFIMIGGKHVPIAE